MKNLILVLLISFAFANNQFAQGDYKWNIDLEHSSVEFKIKHLVSNVTGRFTDFSGTLVFNPNDLANSKADFTVKVKSVNTNNEKRDAHLQSEDFFDVEKYPNMTFKSTSFKKAGKSYVIEGNLTIRNTTKKVSIPFTVDGVIDSPWKKGVEIMGVTGSTSIKRNDYGVGTGSWAATAMVGNNVEITIHLEADRNK
jgi:polyisoprenoid-binding protein YceI